MAGNLFSYSGPLDPADMINRDGEAGELYEDLASGHWVPLYALLGGPLPAF